MNDPAFGLPDRQRIGPKRDRRASEASRLKRYAAACRSARWWIESVHRAFADRDPGEVQRLLNFHRAVLDRLDDALNPNHGEPDG